MCQILFSESENPPAQALSDGNFMNKDGFGYAYASEGKVHYSKGFSAEEMDTEFIDSYFALPFPKAIHFRLATHGGTSQQLTHPFPIKRGNPHDLNGTAPAVLFHNGIWHSYDDRLRDAILGGTLNPNVLKGGMSDSRAMAVLVQRFGEEVLDILNLGVNKVLVLRGDTFYTYGSWIKKEGWSASSSRIFLVEPRAEGKVRKGVALGANGLPLRGHEVAGGVQAGHLNRHGNVRARFRRGYVRSGERDLGTQAGKVDVERVLSEQDEAIAQALREHERERASGVYLTATSEEIRQHIIDWNRKGVN